MKMNDLTALGRRIDPYYPTNRAIALLALVATVVVVIWRLFSGGALLDSALEGIGVGFVLFLTWALGRELDPDHDLSAFAGAGLALIGVLFFDTPSLLVFFWLLMVLRLVNRTAGVPARPLDSMAVLGLGAWLTWQGDWVVGLVTAVAFLLDGLLSPPLRIHLYVSGLAFACTAALSIFAGDMVMEGGATMLTVIASVLMAGLFLVVITTTRELRSVGDAAVGSVGKPLSPRRVQAGQALALGTALLFVWWAGAAGLETLFPLWAAMSGVGLYRLVVLFQRHSRRFMLEKESY